MNKAIFWDFDGTLVHSDTLWSGAVQTVAALDIAGGRAAGMETIHVHSKENCDADFCCAALAQIPGWLSR